MRFLNDAYEDGRHETGIAVGGSCSVDVSERFYRSAVARGLPGSGLGLAIVRQVAETHGGLVVAENAEGGGALLRLSLPLHHDMP